MVEGEETGDSARERGLDVTLHERRAGLGGRARTTHGAYRANWGPHVIYADGPLWTWLEDRGLARPAAGVSIVRPAFRVDGRARLVPPPRVARAFVHLRTRAAPVDRTFLDWAGEELRDAATARQVADFMGVATFDHDPGRLSAAFVNERLRRATSVPPQAKYIPGGWATLVERLAGRARALGVRIELRSEVDSLPSPPVVLAVPLPAAARLLGDEHLSWTGTTVAVLDVGVRRRRLDPFFVSDLDAPGWLERYSGPDPPLAPEGHSLIQGQVGVRPDETPDQAIARLEELVDAGYPDWRARETWRRRLVLTDETGALDLPGTTWRDRPAIDRGDGVHLVGDMVAAPGLLAEVSFNAAVAAVDAVAHERTAVG